MSEDVEQVGDMQRMQSKASYQSVFHNVLQDRLTTIVLGDPVNLQRVSSTATSHLNLGCIRFTCQGKEVKAECQSLRSLPSLILNVLGL